MAWLLPGLLVATVLALLASGLFPWQRLSRSAQRSGRATTWLAIVALLASLAASVHVMIAGTIDYSFYVWQWPLPCCLGVYVDAVSAVMLVLISFIGLIIARYSTRYLQGDAQQGRFFRWMALTLGGTLLLVMACNLVMLTAAWMLISFGLHQLLTYYPERTWGVWAARKKFLISRLGDAMLIAALVLTYRSFGTTEFTNLFAAANAIHEGAATGSFTAELIGILFVLGAMTKSAQFPFHSWLPDTMETPTPVSALMHAGVINAGGFLVIRLSPLVSLSPGALDLLAILGAITALLGSLVMLTQTSIKRSLAYSTIAQMGFMMLQCGLGAFSAALLHIVAHSAYKAHAFLSCGSVLDSAARMKAPPIPASSGSRKLLALVAAFALATGIVALASGILGSGIFAKPGGMLLGFILTLAVAQLLWKGLAAGSLWLTSRGIAYGLIVAVAYGAAYWAMDGWLMARSVHWHTLAPSALDDMIGALVATGFLGIFTLQALSEPLARHRWMQRLYVHAMNGFYIDIPARRLTAWVYGIKAPVQ